MQIYFLAKCDNIACAFFMHLFTAINLNFRRSSETTESIATCIRAWFLTVCCACRQPKPMIPHCVPVSWRDGVHVSLNSKTKKINTNNVEFREKYVYFGAVCILVIDFYGPKWYSANYQRSKSSKFTNSDTCVLLAGTNSFFD